MRLRRKSRAIAAAIWGAGALVGLFGIGCSFTVDTDKLNEGDEEDEGLNCAADEKACTIPGEKTIGECIPDDAPQTGCANPDSCEPCSLREAAARCTKDGLCGISICNQGFDDCNENDSDGCEVHTDLDEANCGQCGRVCARSNALANCIKGSCLLVVCSPGFGNCDDNQTNGCEVNLKTSLEHCGECGTLCDGTCVAGECM
jgi:hypothetical protein